MFIFRLLVGPRIRVVHSVSFEFVVSARVAAPGCRVRVLFVFVVLFSFLATALRVHLAVTRLTVYRRPQVVFWQRGVFNREFIEM